MNDSERWDLLRSGDKSILASIYSEEVSFLILYGKRITNSTPIIEDAIQELFIEIWQRKSSLGPTDNIRKYLLVSLRRKIIAIINKNEKKYRDSAPEDEELPTSESHETNLIDWQNSEEQELSLKKAIEGLSLRQKEIIHLKYSLGLNNKAIGEVMGLSYQSTRNLLAAAIKNIKKLLPFLIFLLWTWVQKMIF